MLPVVVTLTRDELAELARKWVEESCEAQHLPAKIDDEVTMGNVALLLAGPAEEVA